MEDGFLHQIRLLQVPNNALRPFQRTRKFLRLHQQDSR